PLQYAVTVNVDSRPGWLAGVAGPRGWTCPAHPAENRAPMAAMAEQESSLVHGQAAPLGTNRHPPPARAAKGRPPHRAAREHASYCRAQLAGDAEEISLVEITSHA